MYLMSTYLMNNLRVDIKYKKIKISIDFYLVFMYIIYVSDKAYKYCFKETI